MKILIVDDEPIAQDILERYIHKIPGIVIVGKCSNALEAFSIINRKDIDVVLLDINMPEISGIDFIKMLKKPPLVIFTTAYSEHAAESYELNAIDYLVKPVSFERFLKAINKADSIMQTALVKSIGNSISVPMEEQILFVKSDGKLIKINLAHLWLIEGLKDYIRLWTDSDSIIVHATMKSMQEQLSCSPMFMRINKSYIVNVKYITEVDGNTIKLKNKVVAIGVTYRDIVRDLLNKLKMQ